jgi:hypothetical protein
LRNKTRHANGVTQTLFLHIPAHPKSPLELLHDFLDGSTVEYAFRITTGSAVTLLRHECRLVHGQCEMRSDRPYPDFSGSVGLCDKDRPDFLPVAASFASFSFRKENED